MADDPVSDDKVGYRRPPRNTRFKKGKSGNPSGRPKGSKNLATIIHTTVSEKVVINENGRRRTISKLEAAAMQAANRAAAGDPRASRLLFDLLQQLDGGAAQPPSRILPDADKQIMKRLVARMRATGKPRKESSDD